MLRLVILFFSSLVLVPVNVLADEIAAPKAEQSFYVSFLGHSENREGSPGTRVKLNNFSILAGWDRLIMPDRNFYVGVRGGLLREQVLTSVPVGEVQNRPFVGAQAYTFLPLNASIGGTIGGAVDLVHGGDAFAVGMQMSARFSARVYLVPGIYGEIPLEIGVFPFFDGTPLFTRFGGQLGFDL